MPSIYAHYRFGAEMIAKMPKRQQRTVTRFRQLYDMGLQGPDIFYYQGLIKGEAIGDLYHNETGIAFFERVCAVVRSNPSEGARAYLYGVLAHYALDSLSHPFINRMAQEGSLSHSQIETEFDRYLLFMDGKKPPHLQDLSKHIRLTPGECQTAAAFYPKIKTRQLKTHIHRMAVITKALVLPQGYRRKLMEKTVGILQPRIAGRFMGVHTATAGRKLNPDLMRLYEIAAQRYPILLEQIQAHMRNKEPLGTDFSVPFC